MDEMTKLLQVMARLRDPEHGCPWDRVQTYATIAPYTIEEAYEVADAIAHGTLDDLKDELGDLLFQVVFYAQIAKEEHAFEFADVAAAMTSKLIRRHPHVFGSARFRNSAEQRENWEQIKAAERRSKHDSSLDGVALALPALLRALKLQKKAARAGFDWPDSAPVFAKVEEELGEIRALLPNTSENNEQLQEEIGDLLFTCVNLARHLAVEPEHALRVANSKFETRFRKIEHWLRESGDSLEQASPAELDRLWERAKREERKPA